MPIYPRIHLGNPDLHLLLPQPGTNEHFQGTDTEGIYREHLKKLGPDWLYRTRQVHYTWNPSGYRCPAWPEIDWSDSHVLMGCSLVAGIGLDDADTLDRVLAQIIGKPCVNLGVPAGGLQVLHYNTLRMIDAGIRPLSVSLLSPQWTRTVYFDNPSVNMGSWMLTEMGADYDPNLREYYYQHARTSPNAELHGYMHLRAIEAEWRNVGVPIHIWSLDDLGVDWHNFPDLARDRAHPGIETVKLWAERMAQAITPKP